MCSFLRFFPLGAPIPDRDAPGTGLAGPARISYQCGTEIPKEIRVQKPRKTSTVTYVIANLSFWLYKAGVEVLCVCSKSAEAD